jgi:deoxycytidine triphosphate deaminase
MILGVDECLRLVKEKKLVEDLSERELKKPDVGFDLRINELYEVVGEGFLHIEDRRTPELKLVAKGSGKFKLKPNTAYVMKTTETVNLPGGVLGLIFPRSTLYRSGIVLLGGIVDPGYKGALSFGLFNLGPKGFEIEIGARAAHILFFEVKGETQLYRGQWQGGRVSTETEKQI